MPHNWKYIETINSVPKWNCINCGSDFYSLWKPLPNDFWDDSKSCEEIIIQQIMKS